MTTDERKSTDGVRAGLIATVDTPVRFFVLLMLIVEGIVGVLSGTVFSGAQRTIALYGIFFTMLALIAVVALFAWHRPEALWGVRREADVSASELTLRLEMEINRITADNQKLTVENTRLADELSNLNSLRSRIWAILARGPVTLPEIVKELGYQSDDDGRSKAMAIIGLLAEAGVIEADKSRPMGHYCLKQS